MPFFRCSKILGEAGRQEILQQIGVMNGPLKFLTARKILPLLDLLAKFKRVLACSCSPNFCVARKLAKQIFYFCSCSQKNGIARHARECSQRPFVTPTNVPKILDLKLSSEQIFSENWRWVPQLDSEKLWNWIHSSPSYVSCFLLCILK